jgi:signal transduction histidine kinase
LAHQKILQHKKVVTEEEQFRAQLQMLKEAAHDLNQPLMTLLSNIDLMGMDKDNPEKHAQYVEKIEKAGLRIANTVKKIQSICDYDTNPYLFDSPTGGLDKR